MISYEREGPGRVFAYLAAASASFLIGHYAHPAFISAFGFEALAFYRTIRPRRVKRIGEMEIITPIRKKLQATQGSLPDIVIEVSPSLSLLKPKETHLMEK